MLIGLVEQYGVFLIDMSNISAPKLASTVISNTLLNFQINDDETFLFSCNEIYGIKIYDITDKNNPTLIGSADSNSNVIN